MKNPYPEFIIDETSGCEVKNGKHTLWQEGYQARRIESGDYPLGMTELVSGSGQTTIYA